MNKKIKNLNSSIDELEDLNSKFKSELNLKNNKISELTTEIDKINDQNFIETKNFLFEIEKIKIKNEHLNSELNNKNNSLTSINNRVEEYKSTFDDQKDTIKTLYDQKIKDLKQQIEIETQTMVESH